jgi:trk system potassium uptake protein
MLVGLVWLKNLCSMNIARTICLGFLSVILIGTFFLTLPFTGTSGTWNSPLVALFTTTSAVCVTGLSVVDVGTYFSFWGQLGIAIEAQVGGLGYMSLTTLLMLLLGRKFDFKQKLAIQDSFDRPFLQGSKSLIASILYTTLVFEILGAAIMFPGFAQQYGVGLGFWYAVFHSVSAWNNAGFALFKDNLMSYHGSIPINVAITGLIIFGGIGYQVIIELYMSVHHRLKRRPGRFLWSLNFKVAVSTTILLLLVGTVAIFLAEYRNPETIGKMSFSDQVWAAWFQSVTTRTAGFNTIDNGKMTTAALFVTMGLMFIGASPSGTGGGVKTTTFGILASATRSSLQGKSEVVLFDRLVSTALLVKAVAVVFGSAAVVVIGSVLIAVTDGQFGAIQVLFEVISAFATVGLSTGITAQLSATSQLILVAVMYMGRVGVALLISAILGAPKPSAVKYPSENLLVG